MRVFLLSGPHTSLHICNHIHYKELDLQQNFPKMRGGSKVVWNFSKTSSNLVAGPFPYAEDNMLKYLKYKYTHIYIRINLGHAPSESTPEHPCLTCLTFYHDLACL